MEITTLDYAIDCFIGEIGRLLTAEVKPNEVRQTLPGLVKVIGAGTGFNRSIMCGFEKNNVNIMLNVSVYNGVSDITIIVSQVIGGCQYATSFPSSTPANIIAGFVVSRFK